MKRIAGSNKRIITRISDIIKNHVRLLNQHDTVAVKRQQAKRDIVIYVKRKAI